MCKVCGTRQVQVSRHLAKAGMAEQFSGLSKDQKEKFWKAIRNDGSKNNILKMAKRSLIEYEEREIQSGALGDYKPLSWYERQGYDGQKIEERCDDTMEHRVLGTCYRVEIVGGGETWRRGTRQTDEANEEQTEGNSAPLAIGSGASSSSSHIALAAEAAKQQAAAAKDKMFNFKKEMAELQKTKKKNEEEAQKVLREVSGELVIIEQLVKARQFKALEKDFTIVAEGSDLLLGRFEWICEG